MEPPEGILGLRRWAEAGEKERAGSGTCPQVKVLRSLASFLQDRISFSKGFLEWRPSERAGNK